MKNPMLLIFVACSVFAQYDAFDGMIGATDANGMTNCISDYMLHVYKPAVENSNTTQAEIEIIVAKLSAMSNQVQDQLVAELENNEISLYRFAELQCDVVRKMVEVNWNSGGFDKGLAFLNRTSGPVFGTDLEVDLLETALLMIHQVKPRGDAMELNYLSRIVNHPQFMRNPNPLARRAQAERLVSLAMRLSEANRKSEAVQYLNLFFQKAQVCDCMQLSSVSPVLDLYNNLTTNYKASSELPASFYSWFDSLSQNPDGINRYYSEEEELAFQQEMENIIKNTLNSSQDGKK